MTGRGSLIADAPEETKTPNRSLGPRARKIIVDLLIRLEGRACRRCAAPIDETYRCNGHTIELDHINGGPKDYDPENLSLLCKSCNLAKRNSQTSRTPARLTSMTKVSAGEGNEHTSVPSDIHMCVDILNLEERARVKHEFDYEHGTPQMQVNQYVELKFREWLVGYLREHGSITRKEAIRSGSSVANVSPATIGRYLEPLVAKVGGLLDEVHESYHKTLLILRDPN